MSDQHDNELRDYTLPELKEMLRSQSETINELVAKRDAIAREIERRARSGETV